jgi:hypothetical protein
LIRVKGTYRAGKAGPCHEKKKMRRSQHASSAVDARYDQRVCVGTKQTIHPKKIFKNVFHRVSFALDISDDNNNKKAKSKRS